MKKLLAILISTAFVVGCASNKDSTNGSGDLIVVKHHHNDDVKKHHKKKNASMSDSKFGG